MLHRIAQTTRASQKFFGSKNAHYWECQSLGAQAPLWAVVLGAHLGTAGVEGLSYIMCGPTSNHLHPQFSSYGANQHSHIHIAAIFRIVMGKLRLHLSSIPRIENAIQTLYATSTTSFKLAETPMATLRATFHGTCSKRALIIKGLITLPQDVSISVILTTEC